MKAAVVTSFHSPLEIQELSIPEPGPGQLLGIGIVAKKGAGAGGPALDSRVAVAWLGSACGHCRACIGAGKPCADRKLDQVSESIADVLSGHIAARVVFQL